MPIYITVYVKYVCCFDSQCNTGMRSHMGFTQVNSMKNCSKSIGPGTIENNIKYSLLHPCKIVLRYIEIF